MEAKEELANIIDIIATLKEKFKADHIIDVALGRATADVKSYSQNELEQFGCLDHSDERTLNAVIRQAIIAGYLARDIENYGLLKITKSGMDFLSKPKSFKIVEDNEFSGEEEEVPLKGGATCAVDPELYSILKDLRKKIAKRHQLPPYVIFQDPSLEAMATTYPVTMDELANITGVGQGKAKRYGEDFLHVIRTHVEENEIERPEDLRVRSVANKSKQKIAIIQGIDRKIPLDELAASKDLDFYELLDEIEAIVFSGTKININYFLDQVIDPEIQNEIFDYFRESESGDIDTAIQELGADYSEEEIRLVRIKFLSELGN